MKLALGTVQFGLGYGAANKTGKIVKNEVFKILEYAYNASIDTLDTAYSYGESERVIGEFIAKSGKKFNIISKMAPLVDHNTLTVKEDCLKTLEKLKQPRIYGYLIHKFDDIISCKENLWNEIKLLKQERIVERIGFSLYKPEELDFLLNNDIVFDIVQIPYSIFDQRFKKYFPVLKEKNIEVHARSVFLQGLFFMETDKINEKFRFAKYVTDAIERMHSVSRQYSIPVNFLCLCFALLNSSVNKVIIGIDSLEQLKRNSDFLKYIDKVKDIYELLESFEVHDEKVLLPYNWIN